MSVSKEVGSALDLLVSEEARPGSTMRPWVCQCLRRPDLCRYEAQVCPCLRRLDLCRYEALGLLHLRRLELVQV